MMFDILLGSFCGQLLKKLCVGVFWDDEKKKPTDEREENLSPRQLWARDGRPDSISSNFQISVPE